MSGRMYSPKKATPKNMKKRVLPHVPIGPNIPKAVTFNEEIVETSIGGTQSTASMKQETETFPLSPMESNLMSRFVSKFTEKFGLNNNASGKENVLSGKPPLPIDASTPDSSIDDVNISRGMPRHEPLLKIPEDPPPRARKMEENVSHIKPLHFDSLTYGTEQYSTPTKVSSRRHTLESRIFRTPDCYKVVQIETPRKYDLSYDDLSDTESDQDSCTSVTVAVRVRPLSTRELADPALKVVVSMNGNETMVTADSGLTYRFAYDFSFASSDRGHSTFASQQTVYDNLAQPLLGKAYEGYNTCLFAYGQTGTGKSYSMMGHGTETGIIPRFCEELFSRAENLRDKDKVKISVEISFFEIYNEKIHDLLASSKDKGGKKPTLKVREHPVLGPYVEGLSTFVVNSFEDVKGWITLGNKNRATAATGMNDKSSRSHSVFTIVMTQTRTERLEGQDHDSSVNSKINLVDLAGSERQSQAQTSGERLREGANINKSLMTLGKVISVLSDRSTSKKKTFIPYRDSVLTWLLKESLGGNSKTAMIATVSPANLHIEETLSTLRYAKQARSIVNVVRVNEDPKAKIIRELRMEIEKLRGQTTGMGLSDDNQATGLAEIAALRDRLLSKEKEMDEMSRSWQERLRRSEQRKVAETKMLEKSGITLKVDNKLPNLVNLNEDPQLSEMLLYVIKEGQTRVGRMNEASKHDIQLTGALIADNHCIINNTEGVISITPIGDAPTYVNGDLASEPTILHHGDRVILGGDHYFRFNHPMEVKKTKKTSMTSGEVKDFEFAKQELLRVQEARLQKELEDTRRRAQQQLVAEVEKARKEAADVLDQQKSGYEDRLTELEKALESQTVEAQKAEEWKQEAEDIINKLKKQKMMLEQEVMASRRRHAEETQTAESAASEVAAVRSPLLELLEAEKQKAAENLEKLKLKRTEMMTPSRRQRVPEAMTTRTDLYKVALLLREANKISQHLKKNTTFSREDVLEEDTVKPLIKVTNTKHNICTYWALAKFEEKVLQMRDLYQNEGESSADDDEVFHDPGDNWERDVHLSTGAAIESPGVAGYYRSPLSSCRSSRLSSSSLTYRRLSLSSVGHASGVADVAKLCKDLVRKMTEKYTGAGEQGSYADQILTSCHSLRQSVAAIMDATGGPDDEPLWQQRQLVQLSVSLQQLCSSCTLWSQLYETSGTPQFSETMHKLSMHLRAVCGHITMFLRGCENELHSVIQESGSKAIDSVLKVCRHCGELALVTDTNMTSLEAPSDSRHPQLAHDICQSFLGGCDALVDKSLQDCVQSLEDAEGRAQTLADKAVSNLKFGDLPQHVEIVVSTNKVLLQKCQEVQIELDTSMRHSSDPRPPQFYQRNFRRSQSLLSHVSSLVDTTSLLVQSTEPVLEGTISGDVRRIYRCSELIQKATARLLSWREPAESSEPENDTSVLTESQLEQLEYAGQEVKSATSSLMEHVQKFISPEKWTTSPGRGKRLLPISPEKSPSAARSQQCASSAKRNILCAGV